MDQLPEILTFEQVQEFLSGFTEWSIRNMIRRNQIPYRKRGTKIVFLKSELIKWVDNLPGVTVEEALKSNVFL